MYVWEDEEGVNHEVLQGEGEQGDPLMPALFALELHQALVAVQAGLLPNERLDFSRQHPRRVWVLNVSPTHCSLQVELWRQDLGTAQESCPRELEH